MLYSEKDRQENSAIAKREALRALLCALPFLVVAVAGFVLRIEPLCMAGTLLCGGALILLFDLRVAPALRYGRFLREISTGLTRKTAGTLVRLGEDPVYTEGVFMRECILNIYEDLSEEGERRFLLDCAKSIPPELIGQDVALTSHGNAVLDVAPLGNGGSSSHEKE